MRGTSSPMPDGDVGTTRRRRRRRRTALAGAALVATVGLLGSACSKSSTSDSASTATTTPNEGTPTPGGKLVMAVTAAVGMCPLYRLIGVNTCKVKS